MKITQTHWNKAANSFGYFTDGVAICNKAIEIAQAEAEQFITADEARALGAGNAEYHATGWASWHICGEGCNYFDGYQYRAIKQPKPADPHAELKALYAQQAKDGTLDDFVWEWCFQGGVWNRYTDDKAFTPSFRAGDDYQYRCTPKAKKVISWSSLPVGVMTNKGELRAVFLRRSGDKLCVDIQRPNENGLGVNLDCAFVSELTLAPAAEQPWLIGKVNYKPVDGLVYEYIPQNALGSICVFKVIGIESGYELGGN